MRSATNKRSRFISRTGTAAPIAERTRKPVALAMASSLRRFSCSALNCASFALALVCLLRVMNGASGIRADFVNGANVAALGNDGIGSELAHLELRALCLVVGLRLVVADRGVLVARQYRAAFPLRTVGRADLDKLGFGGDGFRHVRRDLGLIAAGVGALCGIWANCKSFLLGPRRRAPSLSVPCYCDEQPMGSWNWTVGAELMPGGPT